MQIPLLDKIETQILTPIIELMFALALLYFIYGLYEMIRGADNEVARETGKRHIVYSVIGMFIMVAVWGIVNVVCKTIGCQ